jgi:hypothetical protein
LRPRGDAKAHNLFLFIPPTPPSLVRHARAACLCLCSTAHKRGVCAPVTMCGGCCWWAGVHRPAAAAACQSFFYGSYKKLTELSANNFRLVFCWPGWSLFTKPNCHLGGAASAHGMHSKTQPGRCNKRGAPAQGVRVWELVRRVLCFATSRAQNCCSLWRRRQHGLKPHNEPSMEWSSYQVILCIKDTPIRTGGRKPKEVTSVA